MDKRNVITNNAFNLKKKKKEEMLNKSAFGTKL